MTVNGTARQRSHHRRDQRHVDRRQGLPAQVTIEGAEGANDSLVINGLGGNDTIDASTLPAGVINLTIDGGDGNDTITGSAGADMLIGGAGNDVDHGGQRQ